LDVLKSATVNEIKRALAEAGEEKLIAVSLRLAKYKVENKELLTYLLFESDDEPAYVAGSKQDITDAFEAIPNKNLYYFKKSIRKILRTVNKHARYSGIPQTEVELRLHFCRSLQESGVDFKKSAVIKNLYDHQVKKIHSRMNDLPEDLRMDFEEDVRQLGKV